jgi:hypothetical protein
MNKPVNPLDDTAAWFKAAFPVPTPKMVRTQLGVHIEEVSEMLDSLRARDTFTQSLLNEAMIAMHNLAVQLKNTDGDIEFISRVEFFDSLLDQMVTLMGVGHSQGLPMQKGLAEVNSSNASKFVDGQPLYDENYKIKKGPYYRRPDLEQFLRTPRD